MNKSNFYREKIDLAKLHFENKEYNLAKKFYLEVYRKFPNDINCIGSLGTIYLDYLKNYKEGEKYFKKFIKIKPDHEIASVSLFFCYLNSGSFEKAFKELERFLVQNKYSQFYRRILNKIRLKHIDKEYIAFVKKYRKTLNDYYTENISK